MKINLLKKLKIKKFTNREENLILISILIVLTIIVFKFIIKSQKNKIITLNKERILLEEKINNINFILKSDENISKKLIELNEENKKITSKYFPELDQAQIIYILSEIIENENITILDLNFHKPVFEEIGGLELKSMMVKLPFIGEYEELIKIINAIKKSPRKIEIDSLYINKDGRLLNGTISLKLYSFEGLIDTKEEVVYIDKIINKNKVRPFSKDEDFPKKEETYELKEDLDKEIVSEKIKDLEEEKAESENSKNKIKELVRKELELEKNNYLLSSPSLLERKIEEVNKDSIKPKYNKIGIDDKNRVYIDLGKEKEELGMFFIDKLEIIYSKKADEDNSNYLIIEYIFHETIIGDTVEKISEKYYGNENQKQRILKNNEINENEVLLPGRILVLEKP